MAYVYRHTRLDTNEVFYIGIGSDSYYKRANSTNDRNLYWHRITKKSNYKIDILFDNLIWKQACRKEIRLIKLYGRKNLKLGTLCNLTDGGDGILNMKHSNETKKIISLGLTRRHQLGLMPKRIKGAIIKSSRKVVILSLKSYIIYSFDSITLASIFINRKVSEVRRTCLANMRTLENYYIKFGNDFSIEEISIIKNNINNYRDITDKSQIAFSKRKKVIDSNTGIIFSSVSEAAKISNISIGYLSQQLIGTRINKTNLKFI